jgi:glycosyltransferase involved in cell wall biosynthesis
MRTSNPWDKRVFIVIPAYKAVGTLAFLLPQVLQATSPEQVCVVDDGSRDGTDQLCARLNVSCIAQETNQGKGAALMQGFARCLEKQAEWIITMDADGQHAPCELAKFLDATHLMSHYGLIIGARERKVGVMPLDRICSNALTSKILSVLAGVEILDSQSGYRAYAATFLRKASFKYRRFEMESEAILRAARLNFPIGFINVQTLYCTRQSHIAHFADTFRWVKAVLSVWAEARQPRMEHG